MKYIVEKVSSQIRTGSRSTNDDNARIDSDLKQSRLFLPVLMYSSCNYLGFHDELGGSEAQCEWFVHQIWQTTKNAVGRRIHA